MGHAAAVEFGGVHNHLIISLQLPSQSRSIRPMADQSFSIEVLVLMTALALYILASYYISQSRLAFLHENIVAILFGLVTALFLKLVLQKEVRFSSDFFFSLILPPIVFSVGYTIKKPQFFQHLLTIAFFGIISTLLAISLQSGVLFLLNETVFNNLGPKDILLITIVTSSSDPITALPMLQAHSHKLNAMVSGESVLNCAVGIILFQIVGKLQFSDSLQVGNVVDILLSFGYVFLCSLLLGMVCGLGLSYIFKVFSSFSQQHIKETSLILLTGYVVYFLGYFLHLSGIICLFTTAIIFSKYGFNNLSEESQRGTVLFFDSVRYIFQAFIFAYLGASLLTIELNWSALFISIIIILLIPLVRFLSVMVLPLMFKISGRPFPLARAERRLFWYTGLIRGIIAFAMSLRIDSENTTGLKTVSLIVILFTTITGSGFLGHFSRMIGLGDIELLKVGEAKQEQQVIELVPSTKYGVIGGIEEVRDQQCVQSRPKMTILDQKYIMPMFIRDKSSLNSPESKKAGGHI